MDKSSWLDITLQTVTICGVHTPMHIPCRTILNTSNISLYRSFSSEKHKGLLESDRVSNRNMSSRAA